MGLTSWKSDEVRKTDVTIAKNYLNADEIDELNRIVVMWLDFAEDQARRRKQVFMKDWEQRLDEFLQFNERNVLHERGQHQQGPSRCVCERAVRPVRRAPPGIQGGPGRAGHDQGP